MVVRLLVLVAIAVAAGVRAGDAASMGGTAVSALDVERVLADSLTAALVTSLLWAIAALAADRVRRARGPLGALGRLAWTVLLPPVLRLALSTGVGLHAATLAVAVPPPAPVVAHEGTEAVEDALDDGGQDLGSLAIARPLTSLPALLPAAASTPRPVETVTVVPGDSLWRIAERHLDRDAPAAAVAEAWPRWYEANRETIGPDPDLVLVGQVLVVPAPDGGSA